MEITYPNPYMVKNFMINYEIRSNDCYIDNVSYINMHEIGNYFGIGSGIYLVAGLNGMPGIVFLAMVEWRAEWYTNMNPVVHPIIQNGINITAYNNSGTIAFDKSGIYFNAILLRP
ncbi:MAG: hypothetical protein ACLUVC_02095 [Longibaculum sp.]